MKQQRKYQLAITAAVISLIFLVSWDYKQQQNESPQSDGQVKSDTIPQKNNREKKIRDLDDALDELNNVEIKVDMEKIHKEIEEALKNIDKVKIKLEIEKALKEVELEKIKLEVENSIAKIDWEKIKGELEKVKEIDLSKMEIELKKIGPEIEKSLEKAREGIEKAKVEIHEYKDFVDGLEKDGLLKKTEDYTIKHQDGDLIVNDIKVSETIYNKYRPFLEKHKKLHIKKTKDNFNINNDEKI